MTLETDTEELCANNDTPIEQKKEDNLGPEITTEACFQHMENRDCSRYK